MKLPNWQGSVLVSAVFLLSAQAAFAKGGLKSFTYHTAVPAAGLSCQDEANALASRFQAASGIKASLAECKGQADASPAGDKLQILVLTYQAEAAVQINKTTLSKPESITSDTPGDISGLYDTYQACTADLAEQTAQFTEKAGLKILTARCEQDSSVIPGYILKMESTGKMLKSLRLFQGFRGNNGEHEISSAKTMLQAHGLRVVKQVENLFFYYSDQSYSFSHQGFDVFSVESECTSQLADAVNIVTAPYTKSVFASCIKDDAALYSLEVIGEQAIMPMTWNNPQTSYYSFAECMQDKETVLSQAGTRALGALCEQDISLKHYQMQVFYAN